MTSSEQRHFRTPRLAAVLGAAVIFVAVNAFGQAFFRAHPALVTSGPGAGAAAAAVPDDTLQRLDEAISVWTTNLDADPADFLSATNLADQYYARGRLTGSVDDYARAQAAVEQALKVVPGQAAAGTLDALIKYTLHDFQGAVSEANLIYAKDPTTLQALATVGDSDLELGQYTGASAIFAHLASAQPGAAITARQAHVAELEGQDQQADTLALAAISQATSEGAVGSGLAYYHYLAGYLAFVEGHLAQADSQFQAAIAGQPSSYLALSGLAKTRAAEGQLDAAIGFYQQAIAIVPQPEYLAALGDLYVLVGQPALADQQYATVRAIAQLQALQAQVYNRQLVMFDINHGENLPAALTLSTNELAVRQDIYGWDTQAWALFANGRFSEAQQAIDHALALGTHDALLDYHAGLISHALGHDVLARQELQTALALNPGFDPLQARRATQVLGTLAP